jgi:hypothetical protein
MADDHARHTDGMTTYTVEYLTRSIKRKTVKVKAEDVWQVVEAFELKVKDYATILKVRRPW